ncbi:MAG: methyltransferase domain-containing protein [Planctomycetes bacterium]|nr:methyltransferase domain-containing protein [Planctomycetota bacterium]
MSESPTSNPSTDPSSVLRTTAGDFSLGECRLAVGGKEWSVVYTAAIVSRDDEARYLADKANQMPYGVALWPAAIALAHEIATRPHEFRDKRLLELGAGTGLPGIVAASLGAMVAQTDRNELALHVCRLNGERNQATGIEYRLADWTAWDDTRRYDWIIGSDILYADTLHSHLRRIFENSLAPGGRVLLADPYRADSLPMLEGMEADGWRVTHSRWSIGDGGNARPIAVYELVPPDRLNSR